MILKSILRNFFRYKIKEKFTDNLPGKTLVGPKNRSTTLVSEFSLSLLIGVLVLN